MQSATDLPALLHRGPSPPAQSQARLTVQSRCQHQGSRLDPPSRASQKEYAAALMCYDRKEVQINIINLAAWSL